MKGDAARPIRAAPERKHLFLRFPIPHLGHPRRILRHHPFAVRTEEHRGNIGRVGLETRGLLVTEIEQVPPFPVAVLFRAFPQRLKGAIDASLFNE
jgi:hypothetical protein